MGFFAGHGQIVSKSLTNQFALNSAGPGNCQAPRFIGLPAMAAGQAIKHQPAATIRDISVVTP